MTAKSLLVGLFAVAVLLSVASAKTVSSKQHRQKKHVAAPTNNKGVVSKVVESLQDFSYSTSFYYDSFSSWYSSSYSSTTGGGGVDRDYSDFDYYFDYISDYFDYTSLDYSTDYSRSYSSDYSLGYYSSSYSGYYSGYYSSYSSFSSDIYQYFEDLFDFYGSDDTSLSSDWWSQYYSSGYGGQDHFTSSDYWTDGESDDIWHTDSSGSGSGSGSSTWSSDFYSDCDFDAVDACYDLFSYDAYDGASDGCVELDAFFHNAVCLVETCEGDEYAEILAEHYLDMVTEAITDTSCDLPGGFSDFSVGGDDEYSSDFSASDSSSSSSSFVGINGETSSELFISDAMSTSSLSTMSTLALAGVAAAMVHML